MPDTTASAPVQLAVRGPFELAASVRFLEGFAPADRPDAAAEPGLLRLGFPADDGWAPVGAAVRQRDGVTTVELTGALGDHHEAVAAQVARILSLDVDGSGFADVGRRDSVVAELQARYPGLRPVQFHSPYEAACWAIIGQRVRITQAAAVKARLAEQLGVSVIVAGESLTCFPGPQQLRDRAIPGLPTVKIERLRAVADAALEGRLAATRLRSVSTDEALAQLTQIPGIGPFSAQLVLARGAGHPDLFPTAERRLHEEMAHAYSLDQPTIDQLTALADGWRPHRTWVGLLLRTRREDDTAEISQGGARRR